MTDADLLSAGERLPAGLLHATQAQATAADPAIIIYTSGTQAEPKAIVHTQGHLVRQSHRMSAYMSYQPGDSMITTMPLFWVGGLVTSLLAASYRGAAFACPDTPDPSDIAHMINDKAVTHVALWPPQLAALLAQDSGHMLLQRLRANSGQQLGLFGHATPETTPNSLGMTETLGPHSMEYFGPALRPECAGSFGRQVGRIERAIADPETGALLPAGSPGEILLRGGHMMMGMHRKEREEVFTPDGWYRTGDIGLLDDQGHLYFLGRQGDLVKSSGANISPREVEVALHGIDGVQEAVVLGMPDPAMGEKLVAVIVAAPGAQLTEGMIQAALRANMSSYKVPKSILFMEEPALPRTASGKVPKDRLRALLAERMATDG
ncbi:MAG: fatty acid--CoA ligase family protein, partial [Sphingobium sp.]